MVYLLDLRGKNTMGNSGQQPPNERIDYVKQAEAALNSGATVVNQPETQTVNIDTPASPVPDPKVIAGGLAGSVTVIVVFALTQAGIEIPAEVASALTVLITTLFGYVTSRK